MLYTAPGGIKAETFRSTLQLSRRFKLLNWFYKGGFLGTFSGMCQMVASLAQAPLVPARVKQGVSVEPPKSFAYQASLVRSLLWRSKKNRETEPAPHHPLNIPPSKMRVPATRNSTVFLSYSYSHG